MDREQIEKWRAEAIELARNELQSLPEHPRPRITEVLDWQIALNNARDQHLARLVWNAALDEAKDAIRHLQGGNVPRTLCELDMLLKAEDAIAALAAKETNAIEKESQP